MNREIREITIGAVAFAGLVGLLALMNQAQQLTTGAANTLITAKSTAACGR